MSLPTDASSSSSPSQPEQQQATRPPAQPTKRSSRRANTAERRATHNAVERLRRETLNGRFLDLAALLPALAAQRRPSKSAIVNQSIALITNQRRSRITAARELRLLKAEADALRQEVNDWRSRNALPCVEEPPRSSECLALLAVEEEVESEEMTMMINSRRAAFEMGEDDDYNDDGDDEQQLSPESAHPYHAGVATAMAIPTLAHKALPVPVQHQHHQHQQQAQYAAVAAQQQQQQQQQQAVFEQQKAAMARAHMATRMAYAPQQQQMYPTDNFFGSGDMYAPEFAGSVQSWAQKAAGTLSTPPSSSHGHGMKNESSVYANAANSAFLSSSPYGPHHHQQGGLGMFRPTGGRAGSEDGDSISESAGSSHFSSVSDLSTTLSNGMVIAGGASPVDHPFSFNIGVMNGMQMPVNMSMNMMPMMGHGMGNLSAMGIPSPPHSMSPSGSQPQSRRPSVNIPASYTAGGNGSKHVSPNLSPDPTPTSSHTQFAGMGLMM